MEKNQFTVCNYFKNIYFDFTTPTNTTVNSGRVDIEFRLLSNGKVIFSILGRRVTFAREDTFLPYIIDYAKYKN